MIIIMKGLDEERYVRRCIGDFHDESWVEKIIVIDGGSTDYTVQELKKFDKVHVFVHPWMDWYHDMNVCQLNIALSYVPHGEFGFHLDFDEKMSDSLKEVLKGIHEGGINVPLGYGISFSRRTFDVQRYGGSPHAILGEDGWPLIKNQIGQYPDYQGRGFRRIPELRWINSPHHVLIGTTGGFSIDADIIHYEKDDYRDRIRMEKRWAREQARRQELGLPFDIFETQARPEVAEYYFPEAWKKE